MSDEKAAPELHLWAAEWDFVIAESAVAAAHIYATDPASDDADDANGIKPEDWKLYPDEKLFAFDRHGDGRPERRPAVEFVREFGRGYFASSEY